MGIKRVLLKLSGEALKGDLPFGYSSDMLNQVAKDIIELHKQGIQIGIVVGGGNIFRGVDGGKTGIERVNADYMGMLATVMNGIALGDVLKHHGVETRVFSSIAIGGVVELFSRKRVLSMLNKDRVVILSGGTGNPYFTTDTAAALRAVEIGADILLKATKVDGIFTKDPVKYEDAVKLDHITYDEAIDKRYKIMDLTAFTLCQQNGLKIKVFNLFKSGNLLKVIGESSKEGTTVY